MEAQDINAMIKGLKAARKNKKALKPYHFWFISKGADGVPLLIVAKTEGAARTKGAAALKSAKEKKVAVGTIVSKDNRIAFITKQASAVGLLKKKLKEMPAAYQKKHTELRGASKSKESKAVLDALSLAIAEIKKIKSASVSVPVDAASDTSGAERSKERLKELKKQLDARLKSLKKRYKDASRSRAYAPVLKSQRAEVLRLAKAQDYEAAMETLDGLEKTIERALIQIGYHPPSDPALAIARTEALKTLWLEVQEEALDNQIMLKMLRTEALEAIYADQYDEALVKISALERSFRDQLSEKRVWESVEPDKVAARLDKLRGFGCSEAPTLLMELSQIRKTAETDGLFLMAAGQLETFSDRLSELLSQYPDRKTWDDAVFDRRSANSHLIDMKGWGGAAALDEPALRKKLDDVEALAEGGDFSAAVADLRDVLDEIQDAHRGHKLLAAHQVAWAAQESERDEAKAAAKLSKDDDGLQELETRITATTDKENLAGAPDLAGLRRSVSEQCQLLITALADNGDASRSKIESWFQSRILRLEAIYKKKRKAAEAAPRNRAIVTLLQEMRQAYTESNTAWSDDDFPLSLTKTELAIAKAEAVIEAAAGASKAELAFFKKYLPKEVFIEDAKKIDETEALKAARDTFRAAWQTLRRAITAQTWGDCHKHFPATLAAAKALLSASATAKARALLDSGKVDAELADDSQDAIDKMSPGELGSLDAETQLELMEALHAKVMVVGDAPDFETDPHRVAQRKLYNAMEMDGKFLQVDGELYDELIDVLKVKPALRTAKEQWDSLDLAARQAVLDDLIKTQCKTLGFDEPVDIVYLDFQDEKDKGNQIDGEDPNPSDCGFFSPSSLRIFINTTNDTFDSFEETMDTLAHENAHSFQLQLIRQLEDGTLHPSDPRYLQAKLFQINDLQGGYVTGKEDFSTYQKQPQEEHAHDVGPTVAKGILSYIHSQEDADIDLDGIIDLF